MFSMICFAPLCLASMIPSGQRVCARCPIPAPFLAKRERAWGRLCGLFLCLLASTHVVHECLLPMLRTSCFVPRAMHPCYAERVYERTVVLLPCRTALASTLLPTSNQRAATVVLHLVSAKRTSVGRERSVASLTSRAKRRRTRRVSQKSRLCGSRRNEANSGMKPRSEHVCLTHYWADEHESQRTSTQRVSQRWAYWRTWTQKTTLWNES